MARRSNETSPDVNRSKVSLGKRIGALSGAVLLTVGVWSDKGSEKTPDTDNQPKSEEVGEYQPDITSTTPDTPIVTTSATTETIVPTTETGVPTPSIAVIETTMPETTTAPEQRPLHEFEFGEQIPSSINLFISRTNEQVEFDSFAFTNSHRDFYSDPLLDRGFAVMTGDYPLNIWGVDEPEVNAEGQMRAMVAGAHRSSAEAPLRNIAEIELANSEDRIGDRLTFNGEEYEAIDMLIYRDSDPALNEFLGEYHSEQYIILFACTEYNQDSVAAVESAKNGTYSAEDSYLTDTNKQPDARILVVFRLVG